LYLFIRKLGLSDNTDNLFNLLNNILGIPYSTLKDRLKTKNTSSAKYERLATFTVSQENELTNHCIYLAKMFYDLSPIDLRKAAYEFAVGNNIKHRFNEEKKWQEKTGCKLLSNVTQNSVIETRKLLV